MAFTVVRGPVAPRRPSLQDEEGNDDSTVAASGARRPEGLAKIRLNLMGQSRGLPIARVASSESYRLCRRAYSERGSSPWPDQASTLPSFESAQSGWFSTTPPTVAINSRSSSCDAQEREPSLPVTCRSDHRVAGQMCANVPSGVTPTRQVGNRSEMPRNTDGTFNIDNVAT
jgi:hypothetical protein